jgi:hypothetical protein
MQDTPTDDGSEPNSILSWWSSDIWVGQNGGNPNNTTAQNPRSDKDNDIFVRVINGPLSGASKQSVPGYDAYAFCSLESPLASN